MTDLSTRFHATKLEEERDEEPGKVFSVRYNLREIEALKADMKALRQPKPSSAIKQLAQIGSIVIRSPETRAIIDTLFNNERRNQRLGIIEVDPSRMQM